MPNTGEIIVVAILVAVVALVIRALYRDHKKGGGCAGCSGNCGHCSGSCGGTGENNSSGGCSQCRK